MEGDRKATWLFSNLLRAPWLAYPWAQVIHVILDNYVIHKTQLVRDLLQQLGRKIRLHFLSPYCPNENRIDRLWQGPAGERHPRPPLQDPARAAGQRPPPARARFSSEGEYALAA